VQTAERHPFLVLVDSIVVVILRLRLFETIFLEMECVRKLEAPIYMILSEYTPSLCQRSLTRVASCSLQLHSRYGHFDKSPRDSLTSFRVRHYQKNSNVHEISKTRCLKRPGIMMRWNVR
jgi:hypothetical protein